MEAITIRALATHAELRPIEALQRAVWGMPDREIVPSHQLLAAAGAGGLVLGAFDPAGRLLGFCYGFAGWRDGAVLFYSHLTGVLPSQRGRGVGFALKRAQREHVLARGMTRIVWTYDPLQAPNARLNLHKLGARALRYYVDYYGEMPDELNRGVESDRLEVDWWLRDRRVEALMRGETSPPVDIASAAGGPEAMKIEIPPDFGEIRRRDPALAASWRERTRGQFQRAFAEGYEAVDFMGNAYLLMKQGPH